MARAVLVVVKTGISSARAALTLDIRSSPAPDVFEVDAAKVGSSAANHVNEFVEVLLVEFEVEDADAGEL